MLIAHHQDHQSLTIMVRMVDIINNNGLYKVINERHRRYDTSNDSLDTNDFAFVTQNLVPLTLPINTEVDVPSDHLSLYFELELEITKESEGDFIVKLYHKADWNNINYKIKKKLDKLQPIYGLLKNKSSAPKQEIIDYATDKKIKRNYLLSN